MNFSTQKWLPCVICCCLMFFAATADFVSTSVVTGGYDANRPPVKIEHKCVSHSMAVGSLNRDLVNALPALITVAQPQAPPVTAAVPSANQAEVVSLLVSSPLRC
jgi:hypothetical protein